MAKLSRRDALAVEKPKVELGADEQYQRLEAEVEAVREESEAQLSELDGEDFEALFYRLDEPDQV